MFKLLTVFGVIGWLALCGVASGGSSVEGMMAIPPNTFRGFSMAPNGESLVAFDRYGSVYHVSLVGSMSIRILDGWSLGDGLLGPTFFDSGELIAYERTGCLSVRTLEGKTLSTIPSSEPCPHIGVLPGCRLLIQGKDDLRLAEWNNQEGKLEIRLTIPIFRPDFCVVTEALSPNGKLLMVMGRNVRNRGDEVLMRVWDISANREVWSEPYRIQKRDRDSVVAGFLSDTRAFVATNRLQIIDLDQRAVLQVYPEDGSQPNYMSASGQALSADRSLLAIGSHNEVIVWNVSQGSEAARLPGEVIGVSFLKNPDRLATLRQSSLQIWDLQKKQVVQTWELRDIKPSK